MTINPQDFSPSLLQAINEPPSPLSRWIVYTLLLLLLLIAIWAVLGQLDIVARAEGKLIPQTRIKIVQPFEGGRVSQILVKEGGFVKKDQIIMLMDASLSDADTKKLQTGLELAQLQLASIEAELNNTDFVKQENVDNELYIKVHQQYLERRREYAFSVKQQQAILTQSQQDLRAAKEIYKKLQETLPIHQANEAAINKLGKQGYATRLAILEKQRVRIEAEQDLRAQKYLMQSTKAKISETREKLNQIKSSYRQGLLSRQIEQKQRVQQLEQDWVKQKYRNEQMELKAPQDGFVKDLATNTTGTVVPSGTVLLNVVPVNEPLQAEVYVTNHDVGFVKEGQTVKLKLMSYEFQKYGMIDAVVVSVSSDSSSGSARATDRGASESEVTGYRTLIKLDKQFLERNGSQFSIRPGMQVVAEIKLGSRTVLDYILSPIQGALSEAATER